MESINEIASRVLENLTDEVYCTLPCQVVSVNGNYVDVKVFVNDEEPDMPLYNVPIQRQETQRAYIFLGIKAGDRGTLKFFDRSTEGYLQSNYSYNSDERQHDINDRCFELGFIPDAEAFVYPTTSEIEIGLKSGTCKISINNDGTLNIISTIAMNVTAPTITITGNIVVDGTITASGEITSNTIPLSAHKHLGVSTGTGTSGLPTT